MEAKEIHAEGESIPLAMLIFAEFIEREKKAFVDSGRMTNEEFKEYIRNVDRYDLPYFARAIKHRNKKGSAIGPQSNTPGSEESNSEEDSPFVFNTFHI